MNYSETIFFSAVIIGLSAISVALLFTLKRKIFGILSFFFSVIIITLLFLFRDDVNNYVKYLFQNKNNNSFKIQYNYKSIEYPYLEKDNSKENLLFIYNEPSIETDSIVIYGVNYFKNNYIYENSIETRYYYDHFMRYNIAIIEQDSVILFSGQNSDNTNNYFGWPELSITDNFGEIEEEWISEGNKIKIIRIRDNYFYLKNEKVFFFGKGFSIDVDPTKYPMAMNLKYRKY